MKLTGTNGISDSWFLGLARRATHLLETRSDFAPLAVDRLLSDARRATGLHDYGKPGFLRPLSQLVSALENEAALTAFGREIARIRLRGHLMNRLRLEADRAREPAIMSERIVRPIFIVGLPRTGTSILYRTLAQGEQTLAPFAWQLQTPSPPPPSRHRGPLDPRFLRAFVDEIFLQLALPQLRAIRDTRADLPEECCVLQAHEFVSILFSIAFDVPSYQELLLEVDYAGSYEIHHAFLQQLQFGAGSRGSWVLKSPGHLLSLDALFDRYPDACVVQTHRDPLEVVPSLASLSRVLRSLSSEGGDPRVLGENVVSFWATALERSQAFRRSHPEREKQFLDVRFEDVSRDPIAVAARVGDHFGRPLTERSRTRMQRYSSANPRGRHGRHVYSLEDFGLSRDAVVDRFEGYRSAQGFDSPEWSLG